MVQMTYNLKDQFVDNSKNTDIYIECFTTSHARLMLYNKLDYVKEKVLYFDTDSIIYVDDGTKHIETGDMLGDMLGDMTDELSGKEITNFVSTSLKSYLFLFGDKEQKSAIKGFTLNYENGCYLNHDSLTKVVKKQLREVTVVNESKITRKNREIVNKYCEKESKLGYDKRVIRQISEDHKRHTSLKYRYPFCGEDVTFFLFTQISVSILWRRYDFLSFYSNIGIHSVEKMLPIFLGSFKMFNTIVDHVMVPPLSALFITGNLAFINCLISANFHEI